MEFQFMSAPDKEKIVNAEKLAIEAEVKLREAKTKFWNSLGTLISEVAIGATEFRGYMREGMQQRFGKPE